MADGAEQAEDTAEARASAASPAATEASEDDESFKPMTPEAQRQMWNAFTKMKRRTSAKAEEGREQQAYDRRKTREDDRQGVGSDNTCGRFTVGSPGRRGGGLFGTLPIQGLTNEISERADRATNLRELDFMATQLAVPPRNKLSFLLFLAVSCSATASHTRPGYSYINVLSSLLRVRFACSPDLVCVQ